MSLNAHHTVFNRYSANMAEDGAIAVYDILPTDQIAETDAFGDYVNGYVTVPNTSWVDSDIRFFPIESSHTTKSSTAYYLNRRTTRYTEFPDVRGIPMNYGGTNRIRYKALSSDIPDQEPILLIPSFGMTHEYPDRAKTFETWMNIEPYAQAASSNMFEDDVYHLNLTPRAGVVELLSPDNYKAEDPRVRSWQISNGTVLDFDQEILIDSFSVYNFSMALGGEGGSGVKLNLEVDTPNGETRTLTTTLLTTNEYSFTADFSGDFDIVDPEVTTVNAWIRRSVQFSIDATLSFTRGRFSLEAIGDVAIAAPSLEVVTGGAVETTVEKRTILEFGGTTGARVAITGDAHNLYLEGYGNKDSFAIGEWARPIYLVCIDHDDTFEVFIDSELVMSIAKTNVDDSYGQAQGEWIMMYLSDTYKYLDLSTFSLYKEMLNQDMQKLHLLFGYGPTSNEVINTTQNDTVYVADGAGTQFASQVLFPQTVPFTIGKGNGLEVGPLLRIVDHQLPTLTEDGPIEYKSNPEPQGSVVTGFPAQAFRFPSDAFINVRDIANDIDLIYILVSPYYIEEFPGGTIARIYSQSLGYAMDFQFSPTEEDPSKIQVVSVTSWNSGATLSYADYYALREFYPTYASDPRYTKITYAEFIGSGAPWLKVPNDEYGDRRSFFLGLNLRELRNSEDPGIAQFFSETDLTILFSDQTYYSYIGMGSYDNAAVSGIVTEDSPMPGIEIEWANDNGVVSRQIIGNATYTVYPNGNDLCIAASGDWYTSIPLTNFASFINDEPDIDFIMYSDQRQSPQLVTSLTTDVMSYDELQRVVHFSLSSEPNEESGTYDQLQTYSDASTPDLEYRQVGIDIDTQVPTLSRFANSNIEVFVTIDSDARWPLKEVGDLVTLERATAKGYIDFENSPNSVLTTRWELFDGYAIRIPKGINLYKYSLGIGVHLSTHDLRTLNPTFRRADLFGVATGEYPSNAINVTGGRIYVGNADDINIDKSFSTHLVSETMPSNYFTREFGFFSHFDQLGGKLAPVHFYLNDSNKIQGLSMYMYWRAETFQTDSTNSRITEKIGQIKYTEYTNPPVYDEYYIDIFVDTNTAQPNYGSLRLDPNTPYQIYVDGVLDPVIEAGRWHMVYIDFTAPLAIDSELDARLSMFSDKAVVNYIGSHSIRVDPSNMFAARFGGTDYEVFTDTFSSEHYGSGHTVTFANPFGNGKLDDATVIYMERPPTLEDGDVRADATATIVLQ